MFRIPYKLWLYWFRCGLAKPVNYDYRRVNKRIFIKRNKVRERHRQFDNFLERHFLSQLENSITGQFYDHEFLVEQFNLWRRRY